MFSQAALLENCLCKCAIYIGGSLREPPVEMFSTGGTQGTACGIGRFILAPSAGGAGKRL